MPLIQSGKTFNDGEQLTAGKLNQMFSDANLSTAGVDGTSIIVNANDVLAVRSINSSRIDSGAVITDKLPDSTGKTDGVTFAKMQHISSGKILGRTSANDGQIGESFDFKDEDDMSSDSATALASQQSIKAYVDTEVNDAIANNGITQTSGTAPYFGCRAFGYFNGKDSTPITPTNSGNVASIVRNSAGTYTVTMTDSPGANYSVVASAGHNISIAYGNSIDAYSISSTQFKIIVAQKSAGPYNPQDVSFAVFG